MAKKTVKKSKTKSQSVAATQSGITDNISGMSSTEVGLAFDSQFTGLGKAPAGTYRTYRQMRTVATIALARAVATAPIRSAEWSVNAIEGVPEDRRKFIDEQMDRVWPGFIHDVLYALDYGWAPFELVWGIDTDGMFVIDQLKPLLVDLTEILLDKTTGNPVGLKNRDAILPLEKSFIYSNDMEAGDLYGRSRHENLRRHTYTAYVGTLDRQAKYSGKIAGVIPMIEYPPGQSRDSSGTEVSNYEASTRILANLGRGQGVSMPNLFMQNMDDLIRSGVDLSKLKAWQITFLESKGNHGKDFVDTLKHLESQMMRGWLVPERVALEGTFGTKAESSTHADIGLGIADATAKDIIRAVNKGLIDKLLELNYGPDEVGSVFMEDAGLDPQLSQYYRDIMKSFLTDSNNADLFLTWTDVDQMYEITGLPKAVDPLVQEDVVIEKKEDDNQPPEVPVEAAVKRGVRSILKGLAGWPGRKKK